MMVERGGPGGSGRSRPDIETLVARLKHDAGQIRRSDLVAVVRRIRAGVGCSHQ